MMNMEGSSHLFQLDDDDIFNSDSFLEELEYVEKVEQTLAQSAEPLQQSKPLDNLTLTKSSVTPQAKATKSDQSRQFSFKTKTSPEIPIASFRNHSAINPLRTEVRSDVGRDFSPRLGEKGCGFNKSTHDQRPVEDSIRPKATRTVPSPHGMLRPLGSNPSISPAPAGNPLRVNPSSTSVRGGFETPPIAGNPPFSRGTSSRNQEPQSRPCNNAPVFSPTNTSQRNAVGQHFGTSNQQARTVPSRQSQTLSPSEQSQVPFRQNSCTNQLAKNINSPQTFSNRGIPRSNFHTMGTPRTGGPDHGINVHVSGSLPGSCTPDVGSRVQLCPRPLQQSGRFNTPGNQGTSYGKRLSSGDQTPGTTPSSHQRGRAVPGMGRSGGMSPAPGRQTPTPQRPAPGQGRPILTPRVAQLCQGSSPSSGPGAVHGVARKFPGPAGLLPKLNPGQKLKKDTEAVKVRLAEEEDKTTEKEDTVEEETEVGDFEHGAWRRMKTELGLKYDDPTSLFQQNNIALVIRKASLKQLTKNKVSHLCVMVKTIALNVRDASVTLCDPSGEMQGTIHRRLVEDHQTELRPGCVLVLRQIGVLSPSQRNHYLNITPSNLVQIFAPEGGTRPASQKTPRRAPTTSPNMTPLRTPLRVQGTESSRTTDSDVLSKTSPPQEKTRHTVPGNIEGELVREPRGDPKSHILAQGGHQSLSPGATARELSINEREGSHRQHRGRTDNLKSNLVSPALIQPSKSSSVVSEVSSSSSIRLPSVVSKASPMSSSSSSSSKTSPRTSVISSSSREATKRSSLPGRSSSSMMPQTHTETKRACLRNNACQEDSSGPCQKQVPLGEGLPMSGLHQEDNITDLLDGIEDELFEDF